MPKLTIGELEKLRQQAKEKLTLREGGEIKAKITVHMGTCGIAAGARNVLSAILNELEASKLKGILVTTSGCAGLCSKEPMATVEIAGKTPVKYIELNEQKIKRIFNEHIINGNIVQEYALAVGSERTG
ncbi:MAG: (2Fe-2S) ferredoxin domain-containing protein [Candidatus Sumerlaeia bacterium]|nr:(2Fe-2S) ferredoxin domain-containing protein [Candidatus Sumerlaeia bacterium]